MIFIKCKFDDAILLLTSLKGSLPPLGGDGHSWPSPQPSHSKAALLYSSCLSPGLYPSPSSPTQARNSIQASGSYPQTLQLYNTGPRLTNLWEQIRSLLGNNPSFSGPCHARIWHLTVATPNMSEGPQKCLPYVHTQVWLPPSGLLGT